MTDNVQNSSQAYRSLSAWCLGHTGLAFENPGRRNSWQSPIQWMPKSPKFISLESHGTLWVMCIFWQKTGLFIGLFQITKKYKCLQYKHRRGNFVFIVQHMHRRLGFFSCGAKAPLECRSSHFWGFKITQSVGLLWRRDLPITETHITHKWWTSVPLVGFKHAMPASEQSQTYTWWPRLQNWHRKWSICCKIWTHLYLLPEFLHTEQLPSVVCKKILFLKPKMTNSLILNQLPSTVPEAKLLALPFTMVTPGKIEWTQWKKVKIHLNWNILVVRNMCEGQYS